MMTIMSAPMNRKELSHERIVSAASRAIRRAGFRGVGVADIMKEAGLTHGGFYAHFSSRDALVVEALQQAGDDNRAALSKAVERRMAKGDSRFAALVWAYLHDTQLNRTEDSCVVAALASETHRQEEVVREEARRRVDALVELVRASLGSDADPAQASVVTSTMVGALQLARTLGGKPGLDLLAHTRAALIAQYDAPSH